MMYRIKTLILMCIMALMLVLCACAEPVRIMTVTDLHYISPQLYENSTLFIEAVAQGDGKASMYSGPLLQALLDEVRHQQPDLLLLTGDLTFNGTAVSHRELAAAMRTLTEEGIRVVAIPGNHDINNPNAIRYLENSYEHIDAVTSDDFREIWQGMLCENMPGPGFSGVVELDGCSVVVGDYSVYELSTPAYGLTTAGHTQWMKQVCEKYGGQGVLLSATHQPMLVHIDHNAHGNVVWFNEKVLDMLKAAGCKVNLAGHMHIQHIIEQGGLTDCATGAFCISPHRYAMVTVEDGVVTYQAEGLCAEHCSDGLLETTHTYFRDINTRKLRAQVDNLEKDDATAAMLTQYAVDVNEAYYSGTLSHEPGLLDHPARKWWGHEGTAVFFGSYITTLLNHPQGEYLYWQSK